MDSRSNYSPTPSNLVVLDMDCNDRRSIVPLDADRIIGGCHAQGNNVASELKSSSSTVKIDSLCIKLGIVKEKTDSQKCRHFSMRGYAARMREIRGNNFLPSLELPPIEVPHFRYWLCQRCSQNCGTPHTSHETALVSVSDQSVVQPCARSCPSQDCDGAVVLPFGEGTSGLKPVESRNDDESILAALGGANEIQSSQAIPAIAEASVELSKVSSIDTNAAAEAKAGAPGKKRSNDLRAHEDPQQANSVKETITSLVGPPVHSGQQNDYPSGHPRRKARKVRLLKELLCGSTEEQHQRKESHPLDLGPSPSSPSTSSSHIKRKVPQAQDRRYADITSQGHVGKKFKAIKRDAAVKTSIAEHSRDLGAGEGGQNTNKYQCKKHGTQRSSNLGKVGSDPMAAWQSIFRDMGRADKLASVANGTSRSSHDVSRGRGSDPFSKSMPPPQLEKKSKKILENPLRDHLYGENLQRRTNVGGSRVRDRQSDVGLGLDLSLHCDPQVQGRPLPLIPNRVPIQDPGRKAGFFFGEPSITHRVASDPHANEKSVYEDRDGHNPRTALLQEQQQYHTQHSHASFSQHQNLDFSDPHNKRNSGVRGYSDAMRTRNHQRREMFSKGRSDEKEIVELMARIQHERSLAEARNYCVPGRSNNSGISNTSGFRKVTFSEGMPKPHQQNPTMRRPSSSMMPVGENSGPTTMRHPAGFFHQELVPAFPMFDTFSQCQKQPSSSIQISDSGRQRGHNSHYRGSRGNNKIAHQSAPTNMQIMEAFNKYRNGTQQNGAPGNAWSNMPTSMPFGHNIEMHAKWSNSNKGKSVMNLDLNVMAPNVLEEPNDLESLELNPKHMGSLDSSYSNDAIPAMQLLSLMDAGKSSSPFNMDGKKFTPKPFSPCYNHCSPSITGKPNSMESSHFPYSGLQSGVQKPLEDSRHFLLAHRNSPPVAVTTSFSSLFNTDPTVGLTQGRQLFHKQQKKPRGIPLASVNRTYRPDDAFPFPLPWDANEDRSERVAQGVLGPKIVTSETEICTINQNPADFSIPGPENVYMINVEDLIIRGQRCYKSKFVLENTNGQKRQKRS